MPQSFSTFQQKLTPPSFEEGAGVSTSWHAQGLCCLLLGHLSLFPPLPQRREHSSCVYIRGAFFPVLGPLSIASCITSFGAPSTRAALDLGVGMGGSSPRLPWNHRIFRVGRDSQGL